MTLYRKSVILKDYDFRTDLHNVRLPLGADANHQVIDRKNKEEYYTIVHNDKGEINNMLSQLPILSDRCRTLKNIPKARIIGTRAEKIQ